MQRDNLKAMVQIERQNERETQQVRDNAGIVDLKVEQKVLADRKRQMQDINKEVWMNQINLNRMHKKL